MKTCTQCGGAERYADGRCKPCARRRETKYRAANPERGREYAARRRADKPENVRESKAAYYAANVEKVRESVAKWQAANPEKRRTHHQNRRARKREAGGELSPGLAERLYKLQRGKCACCGLPLGDNYHIDHILPLALGGANEDGNIQLLRQRCNNQKCAKHPVEFMQQRGFLL